MKFGGSALSDSQAIRNAIEIVKGYRAEHHQLIIVTSALPKVTDELIRIAEKAIEADSESGAEFVEKLLDLHVVTANGCIQNQMILDKTVSELRSTMTELSGVLLSVSRLRELTPRSKDFIVSFGEKLSSPIFCGAANDSGVKSEWYTGGDAGIVTDENFGEATPLMDITTRHVKKKLEPLLVSGTIPIIAGYAASSPKGITTTLGRGGSDYSATIIGCALNADEVIFWKDVEGLMTADPKIEPEAKLLERVSYAEASEMAFFGTKAIHPRALEPVIEKKIPIRIRSCSNRASQGTRIASEESGKNANIVKAVTLVDNVAMISVTGAGMAGLPGVAARVFNILGDAGVNVLMISQGSSEAGISFVTSREKLARATSALELGILDGKLVKEIKTENDVCIVSAVGSGMRGTPGVAARVFKAVANREINVRMIAQGSSELNISFVVGESDAANSVQALHREFGLGL